MDKTIGLLGGGQLGQMLCEAAGQLGINVVVLDAKNSPAKQLNARNKHIDGSFMDPDKIRELARRCDLLTVEIEHVNTDILKEIASEGVDVIVNGSKTKKTIECHPDYRTLRLIEDKFLQKEHLRSSGVAVADYVEVSATKENLTEAGETLKYPYMLKARKEAYDGRGNFPVRTSSDIDEALRVLEGRSLYAEKWANFKMELAVMVVKTGDGVGDLDLTIPYPAVETIHEDSICKLVYAPARGITEALRIEAQVFARKAVTSMPGKGIFGVELFVLEDNSLLLNEISPRPHNSAHYTIEACPTLSQYKSHLLAILNLMPLVSMIPMTTPAAIMLNILGGDQPDSHKILLDEAISMPNAALHMYGKASKPGRKIGHITVTGTSMVEAERSISKLIILADNIRAERKFAEETIKLSLSKSTIIKTTPKQLAEQPLVAITMGSDSDLPVLKPGISLLKDLGIPYLVTITSAHRTPARMTKFAQEAAGNGIKVIIAAAGGAAHLPGMVAASTSLPVIGVPVRGSTLDGMDSLLSIVQMPRGVPVATVAINNSINAALLAARILGTSNLGIREKLDTYARLMEVDVLGKVDKLEAVGWERYGEKS